MVEYKARRLAADPLTDVYIKGCESVAESME
jgi:hypothetical protein